MVKETVKVYYRNRHYIDNFTAYDTYHDRIIYNPWRVGEILYGYTDEYNVAAFSDDDIIRIETL